MNSQLEEIIADFVQNVRQLSSFEAVHFEVAIGTYNHQVNWQYRCAGDLKLEGASMRNLKGEWIKSERVEAAAEQEESKQHIAQQPQERHCSEPNGSEAATDVGRDSYF
jgi:hypothetical protein